MIAGCARSRASPNGLIVGHYEREGEIKIGDTSLDSPSEREVTRRQRMKREGQPGSWKFADRRSGEQGN